ncbi:MAG: hypothetical protein M1296_05585 [Chloroflexi bacterium]|nr:hypothetical protein [Chloroflexota bacterium]
MISTAPSLNINITGPTTGSNVTLDDIATHVVKGRKWCFESPHAGIPAQ